MNKWEKLYKNYVVVTGVITFLLFTSLFVALVGWYKGLVISISFSVVIGWMIWQFLKKSKPLLISEQGSQTVKGDALSIELKNSLLRFKTPWFKIGGFYAVFLGFMNLNFYLGADEIYFKVVPYFNLFFIIMMALIIWTKTSHHRRALEIIGLKPRYFKIDELSLSIPIELLDEAALHKALKRNESEVSLAWKDIVTFEIYDKVGRSLPQLKLRCVSGHPLTNIFDCLAIMRTPEIDSQMPHIKQIVYKSLNLGNS